MEKDTVGELIKANEKRDYGIYERAMDAALEAKAQSIFPHFGNLEEGAVIVDAGSGTGALAELVAKEFRGARVFALDISHELMERASEDRALTEIVFGDAAKQNFPDNSVDIKYFSTSGHEIESFGGRGKMLEAAKATFAELKPGGRIIIRDFAKPQEKEPIYMKFLTDIGISAQDATSDGFLDYNLLSPMELFLRFHKEFREGNAFDFEIVNLGGQNYIKISPEWAHEFYLRKDYTGNWRQEIHEKYAYWTLEEAKENLEKAGFKDVVVVPDPNQYIFEKRLKGKVALFNMDNKGKLQEIPFPTSHMVAVGIKPSMGASAIQEISPETLAVNYEELKNTIKFDDENWIVSIGAEKFEIPKNTAPKKGTKKVVYSLQGEPRRVLKVVRTDAPNSHTIFKAMQQSIKGVDILEQFKVPYCRILEVDPKGPPYRYFIQESIPDGSTCVADLIRDGALIEEDVAQVASYVNSFEMSKKWQIDTNPYNWYRTKKEDGSTQLTYVDGKVYRYDEAWEFKRVGLLQWIDPIYVSNPSSPVAIPKAKDYETLEKNWESSEDRTILWWKKYLNKTLQP